MLLETLNILEQFDLKSMQHNSADYLHTLVEAMKLAWPALEGVREEAVPVAADADASFFTGRSGRIPAASTS